MPDPDQRMKYETYIPCDTLKPFIKALAISESQQESTYKVLPDTGLVIGFQYAGRLAHIDGLTEVTLATSGITGLQDTFRIFKNSPATGSVLVFFHEAGAAAFFRQPIHELFKESISLDNFMLRSELLVLEERLCAARKDQERIAVVEQFLIARMQDILPDQLVLTALSLIHQSRGNIRIKTLAAQLHISQSPLEKRFRKVVGTSPKKFTSIVRLKYLLQHHDPESSLTSLGYEAGFYDQAHFIKEFRHFTGETPQEFFKGL